jgi:hypothetical protein
VLILFLFGVVTLVTAVCRLAARSARATARETLATEPWRTQALFEVPDTVPAEWVDAYRAESDG